MELILLAAIAYAAARGVESVIADVKTNYNDKVTQLAAKNVAKKGGKETATTDGKKGAKPTDPGGTFSARTVAPRTASVGAKTAAGIAVGVEAGATFWKSYLEGYREARPTAREDARKLLAERARRRQAEREAKDAGRRADAAEEKADDAGLGIVVTPPTLADDAPAKTERPETKVPVAPAQPAQPRDPGTVPAAADKPALVLVKTTQPEPAPTLTPTGDTVIPEVRTLDGLLNALLITKGNCLMRAEEAEAIAARDVELAGQLDTFEAGLADLEVDPETLAEIASLREKIDAQAAAASTYGIAAQNAADLASATANAAHMAHGGIAEAVQSAPIEAAAQAGYYNR